MTSSCILSWLHTDLQSTGGQQGKQFTGRWETTLDPKTAPLGLAALWNRWQIMRWISPKRHVFDSRNPCKLLEDYDCFPIRKIELVACIALGTWTQRTNRLRRARLEQNEHVYAINEAYRNDRSGCLAFDYIMTTHCLQVLFVGGQNQCPGFRAQAKSARTLAGPNGPRGCVHAV